MNTDKSNTSAGTAWRRTIHAEEFFYVQEDNYDDHVELAIPFYREMHYELMRILRSKSNASPWNVLDLGSGTGKTSAAILDHFHVKRLDAIDLFNIMHEHARQRLQNHLGVVNFITGDFVDADFAGPYDVCVSSLAFHHQVADGKVAMFEKVRGALADDGIFVLIDWTNFHTEVCNRMAFASAIENVHHHVKDPEIARKWAEHWRTKNIPSPAEDQIEWLKAAGFVTVECPIRYWGMTMLIAWATTPTEP